MTFSPPEKSPFSIVANFSQFRRKAGWGEAISFILCLVTALLAGMALYYFLTRRQVGAEIFLAPETAGILSASLILCLGLLGREMILRHRAERALRRQLNLLSNNLARLTRRVGLDPVSESGRGEASLNSLVADLRELRSMVLALHGVRGPDMAKSRPHLPPKTPRDAEWGAEPLGLDTPPRSKAAKPSEGATAAKSATPSTPPKNMPNFLKVGKSDRAINLSEDHGVDLSPHRPFNDIGLEPIMAIAAAEDTATESLRQALTEDRGQIYLEPIFALPHRRLAFSRVSYHIDLDEKQSLAPHNYHDLVQNAGLMGMVDNLTLVRVVQRIRRLRRGRNVTPLFCPISGDTLNERDLFNDFRGFLRNNAELSSHIVFGFRQYDFDRIDPRTEADLIELHRFGFRYAAQNVTNLDIFAADYGRRGIKFVEVPASLLLQAYPAIGQSNAVKKLLDPGGLDLIATGIEDEENLLDMLDYNIDYGAGAVFGPPRPSSDLE